MATAMPSRCAMHCRWDKSFSLIVTNDGRAAINFEHSWGDGVAVLRFAVDIFNECTSSTSVPSPENPTEGIHKLEWDMSPEVCAVVEGPLSDQTCH